MLKMLVLERNADVFTKFYRLCPFHDFSDHLRIVSNPLERYDVLYLQNPANEMDIREIEQARKKGIPVWIDFDHDVYVLPEHHPDFAFYRDPKATARTTAMLNLATILTVPTKHIADKFRAILRAIKSNEEKVELLPDAYDFHLMRKVDPEPREKVVVIKTDRKRQKDLLRFTSEIDALVRKHPDWKFYFIGKTFWLALEFIQKGNPENVVVVSEEMNPRAYLRLVEDLRPQLFLVPMYENEHNFGLSPREWFEAVHAGAVTIAPDYPEWQGPGILNYKTGKDFVDCVEAGLVGFGDENLTIKTLKWIRERHSLQQSNRIRDIILSEIREHGLSEDTRETSSIFAKENHEGVRNGVSLERESPH